MTRPFSLFDINDRVSCSYGVGIVERSYWSTPIRGDAHWRYRVRVDDYGVNIGETGLRLAARSLIGAPA